MKDVLRRMGKMDDNLDEKIELGNRIAGFITLGLGWLIEHVERDIEWRFKRKRSERTKPEMEVNSEGMKKSECKRSMERTKPRMEDDSEGMMSKRKRRSERAKPGMENDSSECKRSRERTNLGMEDDLEGIMSKCSNGGPQSFSSTGWDGMCRPIPYESICSHKSDCLSRDSFSANVCGREGSGVTIVPLQACCSSSWIKEAKMIIFFLMLFAMTSWFLPMNMIRRKLRLRRNDRRLANALLESQIHPREREYSKSNNRENRFPKRELFNAQCHCGKLSCSVKLSSYGCHSWRGIKHEIEAFLVPKCLNSKWVDSPLQFPFIPLPASALRLTTAETEGAVYLTKNYAGKLTASFLCVGYVTSSRFALCITMTSLLKASLVHMHIYTKYSNSLKFLIRCGVHLFVAPNLPHTSSKEGAYALLNAHCLLR
eukprot:266494_1